MTKGHVERNRAFWDADADAYQAVHGEALAHAPLAWGVWRIPESELRVLGDVANRDVLELGCGAAQWSAALTSLGARTTGLDVSHSQLRHAQAHSAATGSVIPLAQASGEVLPFRSAAFDVVFCDHGAMSFCNPALTVPEVARVLRPGGLFAFCVTDPLVYLTWNNGKQKQSRRLHLDHDDLGPLDFGDGTVDWVLTPGQWITHFRASGFDVEGLLELRAPKGATTTFDAFVPYRWARRWPAEQIWQLRRS